MQKNDESMLPTLVPPLPQPPAPATTAPATSAPPTHRLMGVTPSVSMPVRGLYSFCFTMPLSITYTTPSTAGQGGGRAGKQARQAGRLEGSEDGGNV